jgi:uncharacterized protein (TIGR02466 family)
MFVVSDELALVFCTPLAMRKLASAVALNVGLERAILRRRGEHQGNAISNIGGWQSLPDLLDWPEPEVKQFAAELDRTVHQIWSFAPILAPGAPPPAPVKYQAYGWANVNEKGDYNSLHVHPGTHLSVVYYVATGRPDPDTPTNGRLELRDPRPAAGFSRPPGLNFGQAALIRPQAGLMVAFPAWIEHWVHPFQGHGQRISIAINVTVDGAAT